MGAERGMEVVISALTIIEAVHHRTNKSRPAWLLSGMRIVHVGEEEAKLCGDRVRLVAL